MNLELIREYNNSVPYETREQAQAMCDRFQALHMRDNTIFYPIEVEGGWGICQDLKQ